jgi:hypothetical protein
MKLSAKTIIITIILSVILLIVGFYSWNYLFMVTLPFVGDVKYQADSLTAPFRQSVVFALTLALIPISAMLIWRYAPIFTTPKKILTVVIIVIAMTLSVVARREMIKYQARHLQPTTVLDYSDATNPQPKTIESIIPISTVNFELFAFAGLVTGCIISFFSLRRKTK